MSLPINLSEVSRGPLWTTIPQSAPLDLSLPYDASTLRGKHILITGGASGIGAAFVRAWASYGASIVVGDVNVARAEALVASVRQQSSNPNVHFVRCDVCSWEEQLALFEQAVALSPHGGIDHVVANAGIAPPDPLVAPSLRDAWGPQKPDLRCVEVNLTGVLYTTYLALWHLPRNPGSCAGDPRGSAAAPRDRHLLLVGSVASTLPLAGQPLYGAAKHGVMGLFRSLRSSAHVSGVRVNVLCPYFVDTDIVPLAGKLLLAGAAWAETDGVVEAATRLACDPSICGRGLYVGPRVKVKQDAATGDWWLVALAGTVGSRFRPVHPTCTLKDKHGAFDTALWEVYADDLEHSEAFTFRLVQILNAVASVRGTLGVVGDVLRALLVPFRRLFAR